MRAAVVTYLTAGNIANLNKLFKAMPMRFEPSSFITPGSSPQQGAVGWVWLEHDAEQVISGGAPQAWRLVSYTAAVVLLYRVINPPTEDDTYQDAVDALTDAISARLRTDPTLGGAVFSAANEFPNTTAPSITVLRDPPEQLATGTGLEMRVAVVFPVWEQVAP